MVGVSIPILVIFWIIVLVEAKCPPIYYKHISI